MEGWAACVWPPNGKSEKPLGKKKCDELDSFKCWFGSHTEVPRAVGKGYLNVLEASSLGGEALHQKCTPE
jgi:hypothetical protein